MTISNLRAYKHKDGDTYFVNGFCKGGRTGTPMVIYTNLYTGEIFVLPKQIFEEECTIIEKKKK